MPKNPNAGGTRTLKPGEIGPKLQAELIKSQNTGVRLGVGAMEYPLATSFVLRRSLPGSGAYIPLGTWFGLFKERALMRHTDGVEGVCWHRVYDWLIDHGYDPVEVQRYPLRRIVKALRDDAPGDSQPVRKPDGWTQKNLIAECEANDGTISPTKFTRIRDAAGLKPDKCGGAASNHTYSKAALRKLIAEVEGGTYRNRDKIGRAWRQLLEI